MNNQIKLKAKALNQWILEQEVVKEYLRYAKMIENNDEFKQLEEELKQLQQEIVNQKHHQSHCYNAIDYRKHKSPHFVL